MRVGGTLLYGQAGHADMRGFCWIDCPRGHKYADRFVIARGGKTWLCFEDFSYSDGRAVISCADLFPDGGLGPVQTCLAPDYHLSYPVIFEHDREIFLIRESADHRTIELYRAAAFPHRWKLEKVLRRMSAVDTAVWYEHGRW